MVLLLTVETKINRLRIQIPPMPSIFSFIFALYWLIPAKYNQARKAFLTPYELSTIKKITYNYMSQSLQPLPKNSSTKSPSSDQPSSSFNVVTELSVPPV